MRILALLALTALLTALGGCSQTRSLPARTTVEDDGSGSGALAPAPPAPAPRNPLPLLNH
jgi:hypothetical protein